MKINKDRNPIYYKSAEEMDKPLSELMEELRSEISRTRGKLHDIKYSFGWVDRIEHIEGGLTCILVAMYNTMEEWKKFEEKQRVKEISNDSVLTTTDLREIDRVEEEKGMK